MTTEPVRASADWLALREPADTAARSRELVDLLCHDLPAGRPLIVHDLGCGSGSMARWLAPQLPGPQQWVLSDRDEALLGLAAADPPGSAADGSPVSVRVRRADITRLDLADLAGAALVTASALLDMLTREELDRLVATSSAPGCPVLVALSVTGEVRLTPADPLDRRVADAFNAHQRRGTDGGPLLGPDAIGLARRQLIGLGHDVAVRSTPWRLGPRQRELIEAWFTGWLGAACEQQPELGAEAAPYAERRLAAARTGRLRVTVGHQDLLARPR